MTCIIKLPKIDAGDMRKCNLGENWNSWPWFESDSEHDKEYFFLLIMYLRKCSVTAQSILKTQSVWLVQVSIGIEPDVNKLIDTLT